ncbi:hypothetical protein [Erythrobacter sp. SG61-1L]|uniref:hypothetical protein n=1 Tax=Erythrobacter sp. SG61-1L TaxID=1603897 RepID=UPI000AA12DCE|nr:hypothetical protein [Erythrobacter sp. SG61-1L]
MSFREKSAWAMGAVMLVTGGVYLRVMLALQADAPVREQILPLMLWVLLVIGLSILVHVPLAMAERKAAQQPADEREQLAIARAGRWSGVVMSVAAVSGALLYLAHGNGNLLFYSVIMALILAQFADYALQIWFFRRGY